MPTARYQERSEERPYTILSAAMSLDGKICTKDGDSKFSGQQDLARLHRLRASVDAVLIGIGTLLADDPLLTVRQPRGRNPLRVILDSRARTPTSARVLRQNRDGKTLIFVGKGAPASRVQVLREAGAKVFRAKGTNRLDLDEVMSHLAHMGIRRVLVEGGSTLNWSLLKAGLMDELRVAISPVIVGGERAKSLVDGVGVSNIRDGFQLKLLGSRRYGKDLLLSYRAVS